MAGPVFPTKWDFLFAWVLIGVDRSTGVFSGSEPMPGQQMVCVWTSEEIATDALHVESWELRRIKVRDLLALLPPGIGVVVDPERPSGMTATAAYVANLKRYVGAFPAGTEVRLAPWDLPPSVRALLVEAMASDGGVQELHAFTYTMDDSPPLGCLAYAAAPGHDTSAVTGALDATLAASTDPAQLGLPTVNILALADVPDEVRSALGDGHVVHRRARPRRWRR